jgi:hypothetical protein
MLTLMNHMPQTGNYIVDIIARNMDIPGSEEIAERMMSLLPPGMVNLERLPESARQRVEEKMAQQQQQQQQDQQIQMQMMQKNFEKLTAEIQDIQARAMKSQAQAALAESQVGVDAGKVEAVYDVDKEKNIIDSLRFGLELDKNEVETARSGIETALSVEQAEHAMKQPPAQPAEPKKESK